MVETTIRAGAERCFRLFCDVARLRHWVDGLRKVKVVRARPDGLPLEVLYDFGATLSYSVTYDYDLAARRVSWEPGLGRRDAVRGWADFVDEGEGCRMRYTLESGPGRVDPGEAERVVAAFVRWVESDPLSRPTTA
jgi:hypothetical protein